MKKLLYIMAISLALISSGVDAKGGSSSGGGGHSSGGGGRSASSSVSSGGSKGGFSSSSVSRPSTTTTTTTTHSRSFNGNSYRYNSPYVGGGMMYGGWGMGYGYTNGLLTGMIIANMMHPHNTVMYSGPGSYNNNALLYPDGRVVNQQGYQVGTYVNGQFTPMQNGPMVAQQVPADAGAQQVQPQPVVIKQDPVVGAGEILLIFMIAVLFIIFLGLIL